MELIGTIAAVGLGVMFVVSGVYKLRDGPAWPKQAADMGVGRPLALVVPWYEIVLGAVLISGLLSPWAEIAAALTLAAFTVVIVQRCSTAPVLRAPVWVAVQQTPRPSLLRETSASWRSQPWRSSAPPEKADVTVGGATSLRHMRTEVDHGVPTGDAALLDAPRSEPTDRRRIGPFLADRHTFVIESPDPELLDTVDACLHDLRHPEAHDADPEPTVLLVERNGPAWLSHPWAFYRDGEPCETTLTGDYIVPYVLWEVTRLVLEGATAPTIPIHAAALVRDGKAVVLCGPSHAGKSTLAAWLTHRGWGFLTDEVGLLDISEPGTTIVRPFWRPVGVRRGGPIDALVDVPGDEEEVLVPATQLGSLGAAAPLVALVCPTYSDGADGELTPLSPAEALTTVAAQLPSLARDGAEVFHTLADIVTRVPAYALSVDDLDRAETTLAALLDRSNRPDVVVPATAEPT